MRNRREFSRDMAMGAAGMFLAKDIKAESNEHAEDGKETSLDLKGAVAFVENGAERIPGEKLRDKEKCEIVIGCVDDRQTDVLCAIPGGDEGAFATIISGLEKQNIHSIEKKKAALRAWVEFRGGAKNLHFHTDEEGIKDPNNSKYELTEGCGHFRYSAEHPEEYKLAEGDVDIIYDQLKQAEKDGATQDILPGKHKARAVMVVNIPDLGLRHKVKIGDEEVNAYVHNQALYEELLERFAKKLAPILEKDPKQTKQLEAALKEAATEQLNATVSHLAKGKPVFHINLNKDKVAVKEAGIVQ